MIFEKWLFLGCFQAFLKNAMFNPSEHRCSTRLNIARQKMVDMFKIWVYDVHIFEHVVQNVEH
jgi:hypothetical protein